MSARSLRIALSFLSLFASLACGSEGAEPVVHSVRGAVVRVEPRGSVVIDHEAIPGVMESMRMTFPLQDPASASGLKPGDRVRFELWDSRGTLSVGKIETLSPDEELDLEPVD